VKDIIIIFLSGENPGSIKKINKTNTNCLEMQPTVAGRHQLNHNAAEQN